MRSIEKLPWWHRRRRNKPPKVSGGAAHAPGRQRWRRGDGREEAPLASISSWRVDHRGLYRRGRNYVGVVRGNEPRHGVLIGRGARGDSIRTRRIGGGSRPRRPGVRFLLHSPALLVCDQRYAV